MVLLDLFSGIGGFSLAASAIGIETVAFCEIIERHFPRVPVFSDIREVDAECVRELMPKGAKLIISAGFP